MFSGDIGVPELTPLAGVEAGDGWVELLDELAAARLKPVGPEDDGFVVSDLKASSAADTAPRAGSMAELSSCAAPARLATLSSKPCARVKN